MENGVNVNYCHNFISLDCQFKEKKKDRLKKDQKRLPESGMEVCPDSQIPASDYQKTVINYQNDDECINGTHSQGFYFHELFKFYNYRFLHFLNIL